MEQIKLGNGTTYLIPAGAITNVDDDKINIIILPGIKTFLDVESDFDLESNVNRIEVLDEVGDVIDVKKGFSNVDSIKKQKNYVTGREEITNDEGITEYVDNIETVYILTLSRPDLRNKVESLEETVDTLVLDMLGA